MPRIHIFNLTTIAGVSRWARWRSAIAAHEAQGARNDVGRWPPSRSVHGVYDAYRKQLRHYHDKRTPCPPWADHVWLGHDFSLRARPSGWWPKRRPRQLPNK